MTKCPKCGGFNEDGAKFCTYCGAPIPSQTVKDFSEKAKQVVNDFENTPDYSGEFYPDDVRKNKGISLLSYLGILFLIPWLARPQSRYARFHVNQGIVLFLAELVVRAAEGILKALLGNSVLWTPFGIAFWVIGILLFVLMIIGIVNALNGNAKELPIIGKIRLLKY